MSAAPFVIPPLAMREILKRAAERELRIRRAWWKRVVRRVHVARLSPQETVESNLPLR